MEVGVLVGIGVLLIVALSVIVGSALLELGGRAPRAMRPVPKPPRNDDFGGHRLRILPNKDRPPHDDADH